MIVFESTLLFYISIQTGNGKTMYNTDYQALLDDSCWCQIFEISLREHSIEMNIYCSLKYVLEAANNIKLTVIDSYFTWYTFQRQHSACTLMECGNFITKVFSASRM